MQAMQINVTDAQPPRDPSWKSGRVFDASGIVYSIAKDNLAMVPRGPCNVLVEPPQGQNAKYWRIVGLNGQPFQQQAPQAPYAPAQQPYQQVAAAIPQLPQAPVAVPQPVPQPQPNDKDVGMFVMAILGKAFEGTGTVPDVASLTSMVANCRQAFINGMKEQPPAAPVPDESGIPSYHTEAPVEPE